MNCVDVNVLVYALHSEARDHPAYRALLEGLANGDEPLGVPDLVLSGFVRLVTNRRVFAEPCTAADAWERADRLLAAPAATLLRPGERHWALFRRLASSIEAAGNDVPDAYLAAYAVENNAEWISADRGFARFSELRWRHPLD